MPILYVLGGNLGFYFHFEPLLTGFRLVGGSVSELRYSVMDKEQDLESALRKKKDRIPLLKGELAAYWGCSTRHIERLADNFDDPNKLESTKLGGLTRFKWESIEAFENSHTQNSVFALPRFTDDDLDELDPAAGTGKTPNYP